MFLLVVVLLPHQQPMFSQKTATTMVQSCHVSDNGIKCTMHVLIRSIDSSLLAFDIVLMLLCFVASQF